MFLNVTQISQISQIWFDKKLVFLLTKYVMALEETKMQGGYFPREQAPGYNIHLASYKDL
jgi:hypothetical protein